MTGGLAHGDAALAVLKRDLRIFVSYRARPVTTLLRILYVLLLFHFVSRFVQAESFASPEAYFAFVVIGITTMEAVIGCVGMAEAVARELVTGTFERLVSSPFGAVGGVASMLLFPSLLALAVGAATLVLAGLAFGLDVRWSTAPLALPLAMLALLAFAPLGMLLGALTLVVKQARAVAVWAMAVVVLTAGLYFPVELLPPWLRWLSEAQPVAPAVELLRHVVIGAPLSEPAWASTLKLLAFAGVLLPAAFAVFAVALKTTRRHGTVTEY
jgi:ABC-2 type transport system permease protein